MLEFVVFGPPVSAQTKAHQRKKQWIDDVRNAARVRLPDGFEPTTLPVQATLTYYFSGAALDVDNLPKPILDPIKGLVISDDTQVTDLLVRKRSIALGRTVRDPSPILAGALAAQIEFVHILVEEMTVQDDAS